MRGSRRHRPHRHLQLGPLPDGGARLARGPPRLRQRERHRDGHGARGAAGRAAHAGARRRERHRSVPAARRFPAPARRAGLLGRAELPDRRPDRRRVPREPRGDRHGLRTRGGDDPRRTRARPADDAVRVLRGGRGRDGARRCRHHRLPSGPDRRRHDRRGHGADARRLRAAHRCVGGRRPRREPRCDRALPRRPDRDARRRRATSFRIVATSTASTARPAWSACRPRSRSPRRRARSRRSARSRWPLRRLSFPEDARRSS